MNAIFKLGSRVRLQHDDGWSSPGCVMSRVVDRKIRIYWPDENRFSYEYPADLVAYDDVAVAA